LFIDFEKACDTIRREALYNILTEFDILMKLVKQGGKAAMRPGREADHSSPSSAKVRE